MINKGDNHMAITVEKATLDPWGNCVRVSNGKVELFATLDIGPHIIRFNVIGKENMFLEDIQDNISKDVSQCGWFNEGTWHIHGGHRLWISPENDPASYWPDNAPVESYDILPNGVRLIQKQQEYLNIQQEITVTMQENGTVDVDHVVTNRGAYPLELAPWALTVLAPGGVEVVPQTKRETGLLGNRILALWPYSDMADPRITWGKDYMILRQDQNMDTSFKLGSTNEEGYAAYFLHGCMFLKRYIHVLGGNYPDFGVSFETYTNGHMLEMETLGQLVTLANGQSARHRETWQLFDGVTVPDSNDTAIKEALSKYL